MFSPFRTLAVILCLMAGAVVRAASSLPIGPINFNANTDYDLNFKESSLSGISRNINGYLEVSGVPTANAAFDSSATGGANGHGGTGGSDANNDLTNFTISSDVASSVAGGIGSGFLLRLNSAEAAGYLATVHTVGTNSVTFDLFEGAGLTSSGSPIFSLNVPLAGLATQANVFYNFSVSVNGGAFLFDFGSGAATASFTDASVTATVGQAGVLLDTLSPPAATRLDNFLIVPGFGRVAAIDFEALTQTDTGMTNVGYVYAERNFVLTDSRGVNGLGSFHTGNSSFAGSTMLFNNSYSDTSLSRQDGGLFDFLSLDLAKLQNPESGPIVFSGYRGSDLVVTGNVNFNGSAGVQRLVLPAGFTRLTEVRWPQQSPLHQFDNVLVRPQGGAGPGPQARIVNDSSVWRFDFNRLVPGTTYQLRQSADLTGWQDVYDFTTWSPTSTAVRPIVPGQARGFFRVQSTP